MKIYVLGNMIAPGDNLPIQLIPEIERVFVDDTVLLIDPTENFLPEEGSILLDSVDGIDEVRVFSDIDMFVTARKLTVHDYDLGFHLQLLKKLHKLTRIWIVGIPRFCSINEICPQVISEIQQIMLSEIHKHKREY